MEANNVRKQKKYFYTISEKLAIIDYYNSYNTAGERLVSKQDIYRKYNIDHKSFNDWLRKEEELRKCQDPKNKKKKLHKGKPSFFTKEEKEKIIDYVETSISNCSIKFSYSSYTYYINESSSLKDISFKAKYKRVVRLLKSKFFVIRKSTHIGQSIPYDANKKTLYFLSQVIKCRKINEYDISCIINCDETTITFDSPLTYSLAKIGQKTVTVKTTGKEKARITCLLTICADGKKLKPYIIFKGKKNGVINKEIDKYINIKKYEIVTKTQINSWIDEELFTEYIDSVNVKYKYGKKKLLF